MPSVAVNSAVRLETLAGVIVVSKSLSPLCSVLYPNWPQSQPPARSPMASTARQAPIERRLIRCFMILPNPLEATNER